jgi:class 3 adenylate cyclase
MTLDSSLRERLHRYLPEDLIDQLPDPQALATSIRRLSSLHQAVSSFLPQYIAENERLYDEDDGNLRPGTFMFSDVSGFTALSEKLQKAGGREGTEALTQIINDFFAKMLEILAKSNGQLLKFAGDALLTFFPHTGNEDETPLAIRAGLRMQREMAASFQPIRHAALEELIGPHDLRLTMSIGVCRGQLFEATVGNTIQRDHIIQGELPGQAMRAEEAGEQDDVIIPANLQVDYTDLFDTVPVADGFYRVVDNFGDDLSDYEFVVPRRRRGQAQALFDFEEENLLEDLLRQMDRLDGITRFVAAEVVNKLAFGGGHIEPENRPATVIFAHFLGFADLLHDWGEEHLPLIVSILDRYYSIMQRTITSNGGALTRSDPYGRGVKLLITFGAPLAHPDDPERAVTTALEMNRQLSRLIERLRDELPENLQREHYLTQRFGITDGLVFAGEVGWQARREYTVMGDDVNLAARLMSKAEPGQILISARVWERVRAHFETETLEPFQLKGKGQPVQAYAVKASTASILSVPVTSNTPFTGRHLQLLPMTYALEQAKGPRRPQAFTLHGEAGVGKTRMIKYLAEQAEVKGFHIAWANCQLRRSQDRSVWSVLLFQLLQLAQAKSEKAQRRLLNVRLGELGLEELEGVLSQLLFDRMAPPHDEHDLAPTAPKTLKMPPPGIFEMAQEHDTPDTSGIFGMARDRVAERQSTQQPVLWQGLQQRVSVPDSIVRFIAAFAQDTPTLLVIDDLHQAEPSVTTTLRRVIEQIGRAKLFVLVAYEPVSELDPGIRRKVYVSDLNEDETAEMAANALDASELGPRLRKLVWDRTSGRPLFIESLLNLLNNDGMLSRTDHRAELSGDIAPETLPDNVRALIISQVDRLSPNTRVVVQIASVYGDGFSEAALLATGEFDSQINLTGCLDELVSNQIIEAQADNVYRFRHGLTQSAIYETLNRLQRQKLHRAAAEFWTSQDDSDRNLLVVAYHQSRGGMVMRAIGLICDAADQAEQNQEIDRAIDLYTHALEIFPNDESLRVQLERLKAAQT